MRLVTDYKKHLNPCVKREIHGFTSASEIRQSLDPGQKCYASIDLLHGYYQARLTERAKRHTAFLINFGHGAHRFMYKRAPMGLVSSSDHFNRETDKVFANLPGIHKLVAEYTN